MGLIDGMLEPIFAGFRCYAMPPHAFIQRPSRWLRAITQYRATHGGGPNFAYELCVRKVTQGEAESLDLSSWRYAHNGAEPIRVPTLEAFAQRFAASGFGIGHFHLCYGLAEATLKVTGGSAAALHHRSFEGDALERGELHEVEAGAPRARSIASCGPRFVDFDLAIVDPETGTELSEGQMGEIWLSGPSVSPGYYRNAAATAGVFQARLRPTGRGPYLRTGDLGFVIDGELYVAGRLKDLIIMAGRNIYPHDVERSVESVDGSLDVGCAVAFSIDDGRREHLIVVVECASGPSTSSSGRTPRELAALARRAIARDHSVDVRVIAMVPRGALLKTSSGKIRRRACKHAYERGELAIFERDDLVEAE
jgi:acyl-CoA synthetase (AMP-forming)/AMP-acid ligase II